MPTAMARHANVAAVALSAAHTRCRSSNIRSNTRPNDSSCSARARLTTPDANPSNPTGAAYSRDELAKLAEVIVKKDVTVLSDEIYEKLVYDGARFTSIASISERVKKNTIVVNGFSKAFSMTGWRLGYAAGKVLAGKMGGGSGHPAVLVGKDTQMPGYLVLVATLGGTQVYDQTLSVTLAAGATRDYPFPTYTLGAAARTGQLLWTATVTDQDPDVDQATATTWLGRTRSDDAVGIDRGSSTDKMPPEAIAPGVDVGSGAGGGCSSAGGGAGFAALTALGLAILRRRARA